VKEDKVRSVFKITFIAGLITAMCSGAVWARDGEFLDAQAPLSVNYTRAEYEDWTVQVAPHTVFVPTDPTLPNPFFFNDLQLDMPVLVQGMPLPDQSVLVAEMVFVFSDMHQAAQWRGSPAGGDNSIFGTVSVIDPGAQAFHVWVNSFHGDILDVLILPGAQFWDAPVGDPRVPLNGPFDFHPGDPVMIHGYTYNDMYRGSVFVRSDDWYPSGDGRESLEIMEVYGWVDRIFVDHHGACVMSVWVDTLTGDPNHQTFSKVVGPIGGFVHFPWGHLYFPTGALQQLVEVTVSGDFMFWWTLQNIYEFMPCMSFELPVDIEIRYFNLDGIDPDRVKLVYYDEDTGKWRLATHMTHYPEEHCFRGQITHFSRYSLSTNNRPLQGVPLQPN